MKMISILSIVFIWLDVIFTSIFIHKFGIDIEANIIGQFLFKNPILLLLIKIISSLIIVWLSKLDYKLAKIGLWIIFISYFFIVGYHVFLVFKVISIFKK